MVPARSEIFIVIEKTKAREADTMSPEARVSVTIEIKRNEPTKRRKPTTLTKTKLRTNVRDKTKI